MTVEEAAQIDELIVLRDPDTPNQDFRLLEIVRDRLRGSEPTFIYANKNGAHIPYDRGYPASQAVFKPLANGIDGVPTARRLNSYRNVVRWSVDRFFGRLLAEADLGDAAVIYTSDHGQAFQVGKFTHCSVSDADPREALVPLIFLSGRADLQARFAEAARVNRDRADHFAIFPTLLGLMGYAPRRVAQDHGAGLLEALAPAAAFTSGDIFGLFGSEVRWNPIDLGRDHAEEPGLEGSQAQAVPSPLR